VRLLGYVAKEDVPFPFHWRCHMCSYASTTGISSVAMQSAMSGTTILASDIPGFQGCSNEMD
jgi:hypothetical protein